MFEVALLDLDNTLIRNPDRQFAMAFMQCMDHYFQKKLQIKGVSSAFRNGIKQVNSQVNPQTITEVMIDTIASDTSVSHEKIREVYLKFYIDAYRYLEVYVYPVSSAKPLIELLLSHNITIIIATNPLYPLTAIQQRIQWGRFGTYLDRFKLITNSDMMHVSKPNPAYYREILDMTGFKAEQCIMVGDSFRNDIQPARSIGIDTYLIPTSDDLTQFYEHVQQIIKRQTNS